MLPATMISATRNTAECVSCVGRFCEMFVDVDSAVTRTTELVNGVPDSENLLGVSKSALKSISLVRSLRS